METQLFPMVEMSIGSAGLVDHGWLDEFCASAAEQGASLNSVKAYRQDVRSFAAWFEQTNGQPFEPALITGVDLRLYRSQKLAGGMTGRPCSAATWNRQRATLRKLCEWARRRGYIAYDAFQGVEVKALEELPPRWLSEAEYHRLARQIEQAVNTAKTAHGRWLAVRDQALLALMLYAGLREAEVCALAVGDVQIGERKGKLIVRNGKGGKERTLPLANEARRALRLWLNVSGIQEGALFKLSVRQVQKRVEALRRAAKLDDDVTPHALRHTFAKRLANSGVQLTVVSKLLGHARLETTRRYVQPGWEDFEQAVEKL